LDAPVMTGNPPNLLPQIFAFRRPALAQVFKVIQDILRHANVSTTNTYYIKTAPAQVTDARWKNWNGHYPIP